MLSFFKSIFRNAEERVKHPFIGTLVISWILLNWRPVAFFIFSSGNVEYKLKYIGEYSEWWLVYLLPLAIAFIYVALLPYFSNWIESVVAKALDKASSSKKDKELAALDNDKEIALKVIEVEKAKRDKQEELDKNLNIENLQKNVEDLQGENRKLKELSSRQLSAIADAETNLRTKIEEQQNILKATIDEYEEKINEYIRRETEANSRQNQIIADQAEKINKMELERGELISQHRYMTEKLAHEVNELMSKNDSLNRYIVKITNSNDRTSGDFDYRDGSIKKE